MRKEEREVSKRAILPNRQESKHSYSTPVSTELFASPGKSEDSNPSNLKA